MSQDILFAIIVVLAIAAYIQAYQWGWQNGHDVHHDDQAHGPNTVRKDDEDEKPPSLWV